MNELIEMAAQHFRAYRSASDPVEQRIQLGGGLENLAEGLVVEISALSRQLEQLQKDVTEIQNARTP